MQIARSNVEIWTPLKNLFFLNRSLFGDSIFISLRMLNDISQVCQRGTFKSRSSKNKKDIRENVENSCNLAHPLIFKGWASLTLLTYIENICS